ncbi:hypothetical protein CEXT_283321 [Caerostris extrusa]|uniref:Uncharacterized protein n=1 Tax=Caerostris extrusa TaxID=172846 RepID=A0AAV4MFF0_CAEEX|nr:hypothetical protein CEXT_283321 [Caerostris extrusa]
MDSPVDSNNTTDVIIESNIDLSEENVVPAAGEVKESEENTLSLTELTSKLQIAVENTIQEHSVNEEVCIDIECLSDNADISLPVKQDDISGEDCPDKAILENIRTLEKPFSVLEKEPSYTNENMEKVSNQLQIDLNSESKCSSQLLNLEVAEETSFILENKTVSGSVTDIVNSDIMDRIEQTTEIRPYSSEIADLPQQHVKDTEENVNKTNNKVDPLNQNNNNDKTVSDVVHDVASVSKIETVINKSDPNINKLNVEQITEKTSDQGGNNDQAQIVLRRKERPSTAQGSCVKETRITRTENAAKLETKQFQDLSAKAQNAREQAEKRFEQEMATLIRGYDSDLEVLDRELRAFRENLKHELKLLKHEIDLLPKDKRKDAFKERKEKLDIEHSEKVRIGLLKKLTVNHELSMKRLSDSYSAKIALLERQFLQQKQQLLRVVNTFFSIVLLCYSTRSCYLGTRRKTSARKTSVIQTAIKRYIFLQRHQMLVRHEKELEQVKKE